jgi:hypothetical protein
VSLAAAVTVVNIYSPPTGFSPASVTINVNDQVLWSWQSDYHSTTSNTGLWNSGVYNTGFMYYHTFTAAGSFPYYCTVHLFTGSVTVQTVNVPPTVALTNPPSGAVLVAPAAFTLQATAADSDGSVTSVKFFQGNTLLGSVGTAPYTLPVSGLAAGTYTFSAVATDNGGLSATNAITVYVIGPPVITANPQNQAAQVGSNATFTVGASGSELRYRWWWIPTNNATNTFATWTNASLPLVGVQPGSAGQFYAVVTNPAGSVQSTAATLVVSPTITNQPQSQTVSAGSTAAFSVGATGLFDSYRWQFNGAALAGATNATLILSNAQPPNAGPYWVVVSNIAGSVTSSVADLTITVPPSITTEPESQTVAQGSNVTLFVTAAGTAPIAYQWRFNGTNLNGATASSLTRTNFQRVNAGNYDVWLTNIAGLQTSAVAILYLNYPPRFTNWGVTAEGHFQARFLGAAGSNYILQASTDLRNWVGLLTNQPANGIIDFIDTNSLNYSRRFYRGR